MDFSLAYLGQRLLYRVLDFFHHWYVDGSKNIVHRFIGILERLDQTLAIRITAVHFFEPLYKDYSIIGRILGVIFRTARILIGLAVYALACAVFAIVFGIWLIFPVLLLYYAVR